MSNHINHYLKKNRFERIKQTILNLRCRIENDQEHMRVYIKEFFRKNEIFDVEYYENDKIDNFIEFIYSDEFNFDVNKNPKEIFIDVLSKNMKNRDSGVRQLNNDNINAFSNTIKYYRKIMPKSVSNSNINKSSASSLIFKRKNIDIGNPKKLCDSIENEFKDLKKHYRNNNKSNLIDLKGSFKNNMPIKEENIKNQINLIHQNIDLKDVQKFKKKNKLLEYIMWKKCKNLYLIEEEAKKVNY